MKGNPKKVYWRVRRYVHKTSPSLLYRFAVDVWIRGRWSQCLGNYTDSKEARKEADHWYGPEKLADHGPLMPERTDTERWDWVISQGGNVITRPHTFKILGVELWAERNLVCARPGETLRQAIGAAMDKEAADAKKD